VAFAAELDVAASAIERAPSTWPTHHHGTRRFLLRRFPYSVIYRIEPAKIVIVAVAHGRRRPGYWKDRLEAPR
jgi:plasmid stabilization system protein ParE